MNKLEFLSALKQRLNALEENEIQNWLKYYGEIIDDRIEDGQSEEDSISSLGDMDAIITEILEQTPITKLAKAKFNLKTLRIWEIVLLIVGFPLWFSLLIAVLAVIFSLYISLWAVIISLWAVFASVIGSAFGGVAAGIGFTCGGHVLTGVAMVGAGIFCAGLSIFLFYGCKAATKGTLSLTKKMVLSIKKGFIKKEVA